MAGNKGIFDDIMNYYSSRTSEFLTTLLNSDRFIQAVERVMVVSMEFRELLQKSVHAAFEQLNLPTKDDFTQLEERIIEMDEQLLSMEEKMETLFHSLEEKLQADAKMSRVTAKKKGSKASNAKKEA